MEYRIRLPTFFIYYPNGDGKNIFTLAISSIGSLGRYSITSHNGTCNQCCGSETIFSDPDSDQIFVKSFGSGFLFD
jgi:hypothetical protein